MKTVRVGFSSHKRNLFSWLIRTATRSQFSHTYVTFFINGYPVVYQASGLAVNLVSYPIFLEKAVGIKEYDVTVTDEQFAKAREVRLTQIGKPYSVSQILGFVWVLLNRWVGKSVANPEANGDRSYVCVEIVADQLGVANGESLTPEDLRQIVLSMPNVTFVTK